jgi:hypothetical protein
MYEIFWELSIPDRKFLLIKSCGNRLDSLLDSKSTQIASYSVVSGSIVLIHYLVFGVRLPPLLTDVAIDAIASSSFNGGHN